MKESQSGKKTMSRKIYYNSKDLKNIESSEDNFVVMKEQIVKISVLS